MQGKEGATGLVVIEEVSLKRVAPSAVVREIVIVRRLAVSQAEPLIRLHLLLESGIHRGHVGAVEMAIVISIDGSGRAVDADYIRRVAALPADRNGHSHVSDYRHDGKYGPALGRALGRFGKPYLEE